jgi:YHS domain-containing protein
MKNMQILLAAVVTSALVGGYLLGVKGSANTAAIGNDVKCPVAGKPVKADQFVEFNGGKVYFCCSGCAREFEKDPDKFAAKANLQLVQTGQLKQVACPFSGNPTSPTTTLNVNGVDVTFCCEHCKAKAAETASDDQVNLIFADASKGFKNVK